MTIELHLSLALVLTVLSLGLVSFAMWAGTWDRYHTGMFSGLGWWFSWAWMLPTGAVLGVWSIVEWVR